MQFAEVGEAIAATPAKLEKIRLLADYLRTLNRDQLPIATTYFTGRAFAQSDLRTLQVGWIDHLSRNHGRGEIERCRNFAALPHSHGDAGKTAFEALDDRTKPEPFSLVQSRDFFESVT